MFFLEAYAEYSRVFVKKWSEATSRSYDEALREPLIPGKNRVDPVDYWFYSDGTHGPGSD